MITITNVKTIEGDIVDHTIESDIDQTIDGTGLTVLPALIDPHVHFRVPGAEHKETWQSGAEAAISGGVTTVFDMPNNNPVCVSRERLAEKKALIEAQLADVGIPLRYELYIGASENYMEEIAPSKPEVCGIKVFMGASTGDLLLDDHEAFEKVCKIAADNDMVVAVHAEDEEILQAGKKKYEGTTDVHDHSCIRDREAAIVAATRAIDVAKKYGNRLYILHASTKEEVEMVRKAKAEGVDVWLETTPHHLFLNESAYDALGTKAQMNPPLRTPDDNEALWAGINDGTIDTLGTDHAPHTTDEKAQPYGCAPSGVPGIENYLALMLDAVNKGKTTLEQVVRITHEAPQELFELTPHSDVVLVDMNKEREIKDELQKTKCEWSPYAGMILKGWPVMTILRGTAYPIK